MKDPSRNGVHEIPLSYDYKSSQESATRLFHALDTRWSQPDRTTTFVRFTDGITNTLIKAETRQGDQTQQQVDRDAVLLRAYGPGTDVLIDREREIRAHTQLAERELASPLLARFNNGLLYSFIAGDVCSPEDMRRPPIYRKVAAKLGEWHGVLPLDAICDEVQASTAGGDGAAAGTNQAPRKPSPNIWTVMESWLKALPNKTNEEKARQTELENEYTATRRRLEHTQGLGERDFVFAHCDLLCGNIIVQRRASLAPSCDKVIDGHECDIAKVSFIDYEYATAAPAAFDIANHFSEWGGFECDYQALPTKSQRAEFLAHYVTSFVGHAGLELSETQLRQANEHINEQVDLYRGLPGLYWGIWALIQAKISDIDFDYAAYAKTRLGEYYAWRDAETNATDLDAKTLRERRWAQA